MKTLVVEDDFTSRLVLQTFLSRYGDCHAAVTGWEAVEAVRSALDHESPYQLICMDIMMPEMDGAEAVKHIRALENERGIAPTRGCKIIMTTAVSDVREVMHCFGELCDGYMVKPIDLERLLTQVQSYGLLS